MNEDDLEYYKARIAAEEIAAQKAADPRAAVLHKKLAEEYASLIVANDPSQAAPSALVAHK
jgi:hypothetical protein